MHLYTTYIEHSFHYPGVVHSDFVFCSSGKRAINQYYDELQSAFDELLPGGLVRFF